MAIKLLHEQTQRKVHPSGINRAIVWMALSAKWAHCNRRYFILRTQLMQADSFGEV